MDDLISDATLDACFAWCMGSGETPWRFGDQADAKSNHRFWGASIFSPDDPRYTNHTLSDTHPSIAEIWNQIALYLGPSQFEIRDVWLNGLTFGLESGIHRDRQDNEEGWYTAMVYLNTHWRAEFGGETMFYNQEKTDVQKAVIPAPGRMVFFDARIPHWGRAPTKDFPFVRLTLAFHLSRNGNSPIPKF
ncbi:MAG: 2OG-Fe(II) oxygenase [Pseudomonadota bacterium]